MIKATADMMRINRDIWELLPRLEGHVRSVETLRTVFDGQARVATSSHGELAAGISLPPRSVATLRYAP